MRKSTITAMESALSALKMHGISSITATPISLLSEELKQEPEEAKDAEIERLRAALAFYGDAWCFTTNPKRAGLEWKPKEALLDDCGNTARAALAGSAA